MFGAMVVAILLMVVTPWLAFNAGYHEGYKDALLEQRNHHPSVGHDQEVVVP